VEDQQYKGRRILWAGLLITTRVIFFKILAT